MAVEPPTLLTERLELRPPVAGDFAGATAVLANAEIARFLGPRTSTADHFLRFCRSAGSWMLYGYGAFVIRLRGTEEVVGTCGLFHTWRDLGPDIDDHPEAGWMLSADLHGRGLAAEAMTRVFDWFDRTHGPRRTVCMIDPDNEPSLRLAARLGFKPLRDAVLPAGEAVRLFERLPG